MWRGNNLSNKEQVVKITMLRQKYFKSRITCGKIRPSDVNHSKIDKQPPKKIHILIILQGRNLHKHYDQLHVLKGVDLDVTAGEIVTIVGKSGAGKSTLLHILGTLDTPGQGQVVISGTDVGKLSANGLAQFRNDKIGFIFQFHHLLNEFTAVENVCIPAFIRGVSRQAARTRAVELLGYLGLSDRIEHKPAELSGGEQQRVAVARALMNRPQVVFADEPTGNLDSENSTELHELFVKLRNDFGQTFIIVTHNTELAQMSDRTLTMHDGKFVGDTSPSVE